MSGMATMTTVSAVHEDVHERTGNKECHEQPIAHEDVSAMFIYEQQPRNRKKAEEDEPRARR